MTVKFHADPLVSHQWPRAESEWKNRNFAVAARSVLDTQVYSFQEIAKWAPDSAKSAKQWTTRQGSIFPANCEYNVGIEEKGGDMDRMKWEIETV